MTPFGILVCIAAGLLLACIELVAVLVVALLEYRRLRREVGRKPDEEEAPVYAPPTNEF